MSCDGTPESHSLTPQEWNRMTESLVSTTAAVTNKAEEALKASGKSSEGPTQGDQSKPSHS